MYEKGTMIDFVNRGSQMRDLGDQSPFGLGSISFYLLDGSHQYGKKKMIDKIKRSQAMNSLCYLTFDDPKDFLLTLSKSNVKNNTFFLLKLSDSFDVPKFWNSYKKSMASLFRKKLLPEIRFVFVGSNLQQRFPEDFTANCKIIPLTLFKKHHVCDLLNQLFKNKLKKNTVDCKAYQILAYSAGHPGLTRRFANYKVWDSKQATKDLLQVSDTIKSDFRRVFGYNERNQFFRLATTSLTVYRTIKKSIPPAILQSLTNQSECQMSGVAFYQTLLQVFPNNTDCESGHARPLIYQDTIHRPLFALAYRRSDLVSYKMDCSTALSYFQDIALKHERQSKHDFLHYWIVEFIFLSVELHGQEKELFVALSEFYVNLFKTLESEQYHNTMEKVAEKLKDDSEFLYRVNYLFGDQEEWNGDRSARVINHVKYFTPNHKTK